MVLAAAPGPSRRALPAVQSNPNVRRAGVLHGGVLTVALEAREGTWRINGPRHAPMTLEAFAERGRAPVMPGPLVRAPAGTEIRWSVRNTLGKPITFLVPASIESGGRPGNGLDSVVIAPRAVGTLTTRASAPGNYVYRARTPDRANLVNDMAGALAGGIVIDSPRVATPPNDRVFVITATEDSASVACDDTTSNDPLSECPGRRFVYTINGASWPRTERIYATVGDSLHWRVINASRQVHPMHLHGFYYRVDAYSTPRSSPNEGVVAPGQMVVTQFMTGYTGMSMTWSPDRPGNWLFHCHVAMHVTSDSLLASPSDPTMGDMAGLLIGTIVSPRKGAMSHAELTATRHLRLVAIAAPVLATTENEVSSKPSLAERGRPPAVRASRWADVPTEHFVLEEEGRRTDMHTDMSPEIDLVRGEPVAITIVNHLAEPTSVHWHGIEIGNSYMDGAAGFSGSGAHLSPAIAPGDSFVATFAPPRAGTFMYHAHVDEPGEEIGGMEGALIVRDSGDVASPDDHVFFLKGDAPNPAHPLEIDGQSNPDTLVLHVGRPARFRLLNLASVATPAPTFSLTAQTDSVAITSTDSMLVRWQPLAKDGFELPASLRAPRTAEQFVAVGETYDFEYTPPAPGALQLEVRSSRGASHRLLVRVPIRVE